jgi:hypothetical protein
VNVGLCAEKSKIENMAKSNFKLSIIILTFSLCFINIGNNSPSIAYGKINNLRTINAYKDSYEFIKAINLLKKCNNMELISLNPSQLSKENGNSFHGYEILGKCYIKDNNRKMEILNLLSKSVLNPDLPKGYGFGAMGCFAPRHGLRGMINDDIVDLVICFHCFIIEGYINNKKFSEIMYKGPKSLMNKTLLDNKVMLNKE